MKLNEYKNLILNGGIDKTLSLLYEDTNAASERYVSLLDAFGKYYGEDREVRLFSAPGRTEVSGNHTDHQHGRVVAAGINLDVVGVFSLNGENVIRVKSEGYDEDIIDLSDLEPNEGEYGRASALIRGTVARMIRGGAEVKGFDAYTVSNVLKGSGMSSSAAFEVLIGTAVNEMFNGGKTDAVEIAKTAQYAENVYFGKPCGLMDQTACSVGSFIAIDFFDPENPIVEKLDFDLAAKGIDLCIVDCGGDHSALTGDYAAITDEMKRVSEVFGKAHLRDVPENLLFARLPEVRAAAGDRGVLRAIHFFEENERVRKQTEALKDGNVDNFLKLVNASGLSSEILLQNLYSPADPKNQPLLLAVELSKRILCGRGAVRVHGGGFAGTVQAFVPHDMHDEYKEKMTAVFGEGSCHFLTVRPLGGTEIKAEIK